MKIKKGDKVKILTGKDRNKTGKVLQVFVSRNRLSVEGLNLSIKHMRPRRQGQKGQRIEFPAPINASNVMLVCPKCNRATRVGYRLRKAAAPAPAGNSPAASTVRKKTKKTRWCKKCQQAID